MGRSTGQRCSSGTCYGTAEGFRGERISIVALDKDLLTELVGGFSAQLESLLAGI